MAVLLHCLHHLGYHDAPLFLGFYHHLQGFKVRLCEGMVLLIPFQVLAVLGPRVHEMFLCHSTLLLQDPGEVLALALVKEVRAEGTGQWQLIVLPRIQLLILQNKKREALCVSLQHFRGNMYSIEGLNRVHDPLSSGVRHI